MPIPSRQAPATAMPSPEKKSDDRCFGVIRQPALLRSFIPGDGLLDTFGELRPVGDGGVVWIGDVLAV